MNLNLQTPKKQAGIFDIGGMLGFSSKKKSGYQNQETTIPDWLKPFYQQLVGTGSSAMSSLAQQAGGNLVAPFDPMQTWGQNLGAQNALNYGQQATNLMQQAAGGQGLQSILDPAAYEALTGMAGGGMSGLPDAARTALEAAAGGQGVGPGGEALAAQARGDYLYGGEGFNNALQAAMDQIQPQVQSRFGLSGAGGATGGLAQTAFNQGTSNAFAGLYDQNLNRQMGAANTLTGQALGAGQALGGFGQQDMARQMAAAASLGGFGMQERGNQLNAAAQLPNLAMFAPGALMDIGAQRQGLAQQRIDAPWQAQLQLLQSVFSGAPAFQSLLGRKGNYSERDKGFSGNIFGSFGI